MKQGEILYVGKAKSLRSRVKSYFSSTDHPAKTRQLGSCIFEASTGLVVNTEVEALLLENKLIKQHTPKYNIDLKDAKTYAYISLTREAFQGFLQAAKLRVNWNRLAPTLKASHAKTYNVRR